MLNDYEFSQLIDKVIKDYKGDGTVLLSIVGALVVGRFVGWRVITIWVSDNTLRKYQNSVGFIFKDVLPERAKYSHKSLALNISDKLDNFWAIVQNRKNSTLSRSEKRMFD